MYGNLANLLGVARPSSNVPQNPICSYKGRNMLFCNFLFISSRSCNLHFLFFFPSFARQILYSSKYTLMKLRILLIFIVPEALVSGYHNLSYYFYTMRTNLLNWCNLVSISKNVVFNAFLVVRIY